MASSSGGRAEDDDNMDDGLPFPLRIEVKRLATIPLRAVAFGPPRGNITLKSGSEGVLKALTGEVCGGGGDGGVRAALTFIEGATPRNLPWGCLFFTTTVYPLN
jgi:hypothetical protein